MGRIAWKGDAVVLAALLMLVALTCGLAYVPMGQMNGPASLLIAALKAALVALVFMRLRRDPSVIRLAACAGALMLGVFFVLTFSDYLTRAAF